MSSQMKSLQELYLELARQGYQSDKGSVHSYVEVYENLLAPYRETAKHVLEIGVFRGDSIRLWERYFTNAIVVGVDACDQPLDGMADLRPMIAEGTHHLWFFDATDTGVVERHIGGLKFDVIIEDASHGVEQQLALYAALKDHLTPDGLYVIEDVQDIESSQCILGGIDTTKMVRIIDRRHVKGRYDDVLVAITRP